MRCRSVLMCALFLIVPLVVPAQEQRPAFIRMHPVLRALDANQDGVISADEIERAQELLARLDANKDGSIASDELRPAGFRPEGRRGPEGEGGPPGASDLVKTLMEFDTNADGKLARAEVPERMQGLFKRADSDNDGVLTAGELNKLAESQQQQSAQGGGPGTGNREGRAFGGPGPRGGPEGRGPGGPGGRRMDAVMRALDTDQDGSLSQAELKNASAALKTLDRNSDGTLTEDEVRPDFGRGPGRVERRPTEERRQ